MNGSELMLFIAPVGALLIAGFLLLVLRRS
jgi:hypothetical protein